MSGFCLAYVAYLDGFGHIGPYISRSDPQHNDSPVFGLAGFVLPIEKVRYFGTWFYQRKCELLRIELERSGKHPATWEKKGSNPYTVKNVIKYRELQALTFRLINQIQKLNGFSFYVGILKSHPPDRHSSNRLYERVLREVIKRLDQHCLEDCQPAEKFLLTLDNTTSDHR